MYTNTHKLFRLRICLERRWSIWLTIVLFLRWNQEFWKMEPNWQWRSKLSSKIRRYGVSMANCPYTTICLTKTIKIKIYIFETGVVPFREVVWSHQPPTLIGQLRNGGCMLRSLEMVNFGEEYEVLVVSCACWTKCTSLILFLMEDGIWIEGNKKLSELPGNYEMQNFSLIFRFCQFPP